MTYAPQSIPALRRLPACFALAGALFALAAGGAAPLAAQERRQTTTDTRFVKEPGSGTVLASLPSGATVSTGRTRGEWVEVALEGWIFGKSVEKAKREGLELVVSEREGENLRAEPNGAIVARLRFGALLDRLAERGGWVRVRRTGWVAKSALGDTRTVSEGASAGRDDADTPTQAAAKSSAAKSSSAKPPAAKPPAAKPPVTKQPASPADTTATSPASAAADGDRVELARAATLYATPDGSGALASLQPGMAGRPVGRSGEWVRVQLEGWVRESDLKPSTAGALVGVTAAEVRASPDRFVGETVEWRVQYLALRRADELRPELPAGAPYLLVRGPLPEPGFVYVLLSADQARELAASQPLQEMLLRVRIRAARTKYLTTPVVELVAVRPAEG